MAGAVNHDYHILPPDIWPLIGSISAVTFTSGGTESNNHAIKGIIHARRSTGAHIITSAIEHPAVLEVCRFLESAGAETTYLPVDGHGLVDPEDAARAVRPETVLITIMHSNNEVGTIEPVEEIARIARKHAIIMHTDAAQSVGKTVLNVKSLGVDLLSVAGPKLYAPKGVGALYVKKGIELANFCHGAGQESGRRAGTENVLEIVGLGAACDVARRRLCDNIRLMLSLRDRLHVWLHVKL